MSQQSKIEVINRMGWTKEFIVEKPIVQIGKDARNDIVLDDGQDSDIAPRHAQLLPSSINRNGLRLVNLSGNTITIFGRDAAADSPGQTVEPRSSTEISNGDRAKIGDFTLIFTGGQRRSGIVELTLDMPRKELKLDQALTGSLKIKHVGDQAAVQFHIELEGLDADFYEIGPGPVLFPNAEKQVPFRLIHPKRPLPRAGTHRITFHVTAPDAYPGESASISEDIEVAPFYRHKMRVVVMDSSDFQLA